MQTTVNFSKEPIAGGRVLCYRFLDTDSSTADEWLDDVAAELENRQDGQVIRMLVDVRTDDPMINPRFLLRLRDLGDIQPEVGGRVAILVSDRLAQQSVAGIMQRGIRNNHRRRSVFQDEQTALLWLVGTSELR